MRVGPSLFDEVGQPKRTSHPCARPLPESSDPRHCYQMPPRASAARQLAGCGLRLLHQGTPAWSQRNEQTALCLPCLSATSACLDSTQHRTSDSPGIVTRLVVAQSAILLLEARYRHPLWVGVKGQARVPFITRLVGIKLGQPLLVVMCNIFRSFYLRDYRRTREGSRASNALGLLEAVEEVGP